MSDLRTEMKKVMNQWDGVDMDKQPTFKSFGEKVFDYIKAHPYSSANEVEQVLDPKETQSVSSSLKTLYDRGIVGREEKHNPHYCGVGRKTMWVYFAKHDKYETLNQGYWKPKGIKSIKLSKPKKEVMIPKAVAERMREQIPDMRPPQRMKQAFNAEQFIEGLSVTQAKEVYLALKAIFDSRLHG